MAKTAVASSYFLSGSGSNSSRFRQATAMAFFYRPSDVNKQSSKFLSGSRSYSSYLHVENCGYGRLSLSILELGSPRRFNTSTGATHVNDAGSIDSPLMQSMEKKIKEHLSAESVSVKDAYGDGRHVMQVHTPTHLSCWIHTTDSFPHKQVLLLLNIDVISSAFEGQSAVNRQRMVYKAISEELQSTVHAVDQMTTKTPSEAAAAT